MMLTKRHWGLLGLTAGALLFMLWLAGLLTWGKIAPGVQERAALPPSGRLLTVTEMDLPQELPVLATVMSQTLTQISPQVSGRVSRLFVTPGDSVNQGDPLVALSALEIKAKVAQAQAHLQQAQAHLHQIAADYQRYQRLLREGAVSPREFEAMAAQHRAAQAAVAQAQAQIKEAAAWEAYTLITAPRRGVIAARPAAVGDLAQPGRPLVSLYDPATLQIEAEINEEYRAYVSPGMTVRLEVPAAGWQRAAKISDVFPLSAPDSRTFKVRTEVIAGRAEGPSAPPHRLTLPSSPTGREGINQAPLVPGMFARLYLPLGTARGIVIPVSALRRVGQLDMVEVWADGRLSRRYIKLGRQLEDQLEVLSGLQVGEKIVLSEQ